jgi:hypothetical protein
VISRIEAGGSPISDDEIKAKLSEAAFQKREAKRRELKSARHSKATSERREREQKEWKEQRDREREALRVAVSEWIKAVGDEAVQATRRLAETLQGDSYDFFPEIKRQSAGVDDAA